MKKSFVVISKEDFEKLYEKEHGFNDEVNRNHPSYEQNEDFFSFALVWAQKLTKDEYDAVVNSDSDW